MYLREIRLSHTQFYGTSYFFARKTLIGQWRSRTAPKQFVRHPEGETLKRKMLSVGVDWSQGESRGYTVVRSIGVPGETQKEQ